MNHSRIQKCSLFRAFPIICMCLSLLLLNACGETGAGRNTHVQKGTINIGVVNAPTGFNPIHTGDIAGPFINRFMFESFLDMTKRLHFEPKLTSAIDTIVGDDAFVKLASVPMAAFFMGQILGFVIRTIYIGEDLDRYANIHT